MTAAAMSRADAFLNDLCTRSVWSSMIALERPWIDARLKRARIEYAKYPTNDVARFAWLLEAEIWLMACSLCARDAAI